MFLPYPVVDQLTDAQVQDWKRHFDSEGHHERHRYVEEGIWRRTQEAANAELSGWQPGQDARRRVVHYRYHYGLDWTFPVPRLVMTDLYLFHSVSAPESEIDDWTTAIGGWLEAGHWRPKNGGAWTKGDLRVTVERYAEHPQDERAGRDTPPGYASVDVVFTSDGFEVPRPVRNLPWDVLAGGIRIKETRGEPDYADDLAGLLDYLPFQVEAGCGTSIEAGIPPLHYLHQVYRVTERKDNTLTQAHKFVMSPAADTLVAEMLMDATGKAAELTEMFRACFTAQPTAAHQALKALADAGHMVGPVITHNFDVLSARAGLPEVFVRRYDQKIPPVPLLPEAKALLVIGLHADRREVQRRAREAGMKIFFVDPEGLMEDGKFKAYPLEGARAGDVVVRAEATPALSRLCDLLGVPVSVASPEHVNQPPANG